MTGTAITTEVAAAYAEAGIAVGDGQGAVTATITRTGQPIGPASRPTPGTPTVHTFTAKPVSIEAAQKAGMVLETGESVYSLVNNGVSIEPTTADEVTIDGTAMSVAEVRAKDYAGHVITWLVKVRR